MSNPPINKVLLFSIIGLALQGCTKTVQKPVVPVTTSGSTFKLDGIATTIDSASAMLYSNASGRQMDIYAYKGGNEILEFHFAPTSGSKTAGAVLG